MPTLASQRYTYETYTGGNATTVHALAQTDTVSGISWAIHAATTTSALVLQGTEDGGGTFHWTLAVGDAIVITPFGAAEHVTAAALAQRYTAVQTPEPWPIESTGYAPIPGLLLNQQVTVNVPISPPQNGTGYTVRPPRISGSGQALGTLKVLSYAPTSPTNVAVLIKSQGLATLAGSTVLVDATSAS